MIVSGGALAIGILAAASPAGASAHGASAGSPPCLRATRSLPAGAVPIAADFSASSCDRASPNKAFHYDVEARTFRTERPIADGEVVILPAGFRPAGVRPGQKFEIRTKVGVVSIARTVEAVQAARPGQPVFVRAADGRVFVVPCPEDPQ